MDIAVQQPAKTAIDLGPVNPTARGDQRLYLLDPPMPRAYDEPGGTEYVVVSAVDAMFSGPETYIFASDPDGRITSFGELAGSFQGALDHVAALANAGYQVLVMSPQTAES